MRLFFLALVFSFNSSFLLAADSVARFPEWIKISGVNMDFYFQDTVNLQMPAEAFVFTRDHSYQFINRRFDAQLPKRLAFYVWTDPALAKQLLGHSLGFSDPKNCVCHVLPRQSRGHEITHVLSYWAWGFLPRNRTRFINEGLAVAFDLNKVDRDSIAREALRGSGYSSVLEIWKADKSVPERVLYPVAGAFVTFLMRNADPPAFREVVKEQTISHIEQTIGKERFWQLIHEFDVRMGLQ